MDFTQDDVTDYENIDFTKDDEDAVPKQKQYGERVEVPGWARVGRGAMDLGQGIKQKALSVIDPEAERQYTKEVKAERDRYNYDVGEGFDGKRLIGNIMASAPLGLARAPVGAGLIGKTAFGTGEGALLGGLEFADTIGNTIQNTMLGGLGGGGGAGLFHALSGQTPKAIDKVRRTFTPKAKPAARTVSEQFPRLSGDNYDALVLQAKQQLKETGSINPETLARIERARRLGFEGEAAPMTGQATRDPSLWARERNLQKLDGVGEPITGRLLNQDRRFKDIFTELDSEIGGTAGEVIEAGGSIATAVNARWRSTQKAVGKLYGRAAEQYGNVDGITLQNMQSKLDGLADDEVLRPMITSVQNRLKRFDLIDVDGNPTGKSLTLKQAESIRKYIGSLGGGATTPADARRVKGIIVDALDDDVFSVLGDDVYKGARKAAKDRFTEFEDGVVSKIVQSKVNDDDVIRKVLASPLKEIKSIKSTLSRAEGGKEAWNNLRAEVITQLNNSARAGKPDDAVFNGAAYNRALKKIGMEKIKILFPDEYQKIFDVGKVATDLTYQPAFSSVNNSNTASTLLNYGLAGAKDIPILGNLAKKKAQQFAVDQSLKGGASSPEIRKKALQAVIDNMRKNPLYVSAEGIMPLLGSQLGTQ